MVPWQGYRLGLGGMRHRLGEIRLASVMPGLLSCLCVFLTSHMALTDSCREGSPQHVLGGTP